MKPQPQQVIQHALYLTGKGIRCRSNASTFSLDLLNFNKGGRDSYRDATSLALLLNYMVQSEALVQMGPGS